MTHIPPELDILKRDPYLTHFYNFFWDIKEHSRATRDRLVRDKASLREYANAHEYFGLHREQDRWVFREWAPNACGIHLYGIFSDWQLRDEYALQPIGNGVWQVQIPGDWIKHGDLYKLKMHWHGGSAERLPAYVRRAVQDPHTKIFAAQVWEPDTPYQWQVPSFKRQDGPLLIYETHVGMAQEEGKVGTYTEFREKILPRIVDAGYNAIQLMAIQEHPYYGSFGYQVSNFYAPSSRFGTPDELKALIDAAHQAGITVLLDIVHSHSVKNELEGLSRFDGTLYQYFHDGERGYHPVWDSRLFNYNKDEVLHFLLSNIRYWIEEFHFDGFRFDGVTSMVYYDHGLGDKFLSYDSYFNHRIDRDALTYLCLANDFAHELGAITVAEDVSGLPGLAAPREIGGFGFDYRLAMGIPDFWTKTIKTQKDDEWHVEGMFFEISNRRHDEQTISYVECHDQALVGDQTVFFRLMGPRVYDSMRIEQKFYAVDRALALHRLIRFMTLATAGHGYLNFMGNEFGHPEWIDFPREGNNWSFHYARRLWSLRDNPDLLYGRLAEFDKAMISLAKNYNLLSCEPAVKFHSHVRNQTLGFSRGDLIFLFNFNPEDSFSDYPIEVSPGKYRLVLDSDQECFGGNGRLENGQTFFSQPAGENGGYITVYLPTRTALVLEPE